MTKQWIGCAAGNFRKGRRGFAPEAIVIHIMAGSMTGTDAWFNDPKSAVSAHYGVGKHGEVHQYVEEANTAFHASVVVNPTLQLIKPGVNPNFYTIGIQHEGLPDDPWLSEAQYDSSATLIAAMASRWNIPLDEEHVGGHRQIRASKTCPEPRQVEELIRQAAAKPAGLRASPLSQVRTLVNVNLRRDAPSTDAATVRVIPAGAALTLPHYTDAGGARPRQLILVLRRQPKLPLGRGNRHAQSGRLSLCGWHAPKNPAAFRGCGASYATIG